MPFLLTSSELEESILNFVKRYAIDEHQDDQLIFDTIKKLLGGAIPEQKSHDNLVLYSHLTNQQLFVSINSKSHETKRNADAKLDERRIFSIKDHPIKKADTLYSCTGWHPIAFLPVLSMFLLATYANVLSKTYTRTLPVDEECAHNILFNELWISINAFRIKIACEKVFYQDADDKKEAFIADLVNEISHLRKTDSYFSHGKQLCFPIGIPGHTMYLILTLAEDGQTMELRIDNLGAGSHHHPPLGRKNITSSIEAFNLGEYDTENKDEIKSITEYFKTICQISCNITQLEEMNDENIDTIYNYFSSPEIRSCKSPTQWPPLPAQQAATCVVTNYMVAMQYRTDGFGLTGEDEFFAWLSDKFKEYSATEHKSDDKLSGYKRFQKLQKRNMRYDPKVKELYQALQSFLSLAELGKEEIIKLATALQEKVSPLEIKENNVDITTLLRKHYAAQQNVPAPFLSSRPQPISDINLTLMLRSEISDADDETKTDKKDDLTREKLLKRYEDTFFSKTTATTPSQSEDTSIGKTTTTVNSLFDKIIVTVKDDKSSIGDIKVEEKTVEIQPKSILISGQPGIGKTTMSQYFAYRWGNKELWLSNFDYVLWIPLRRVRSNKSLAESSLAQIIYDSIMSNSNEEVKHDDMTAAVQTIEKIIQNQNNKILFLLDGFDEVAHLVSDGSKVSQLIKTAFKFFVIVATRPYNLKELRAYKFDFEYQNAGFTNNQIHLYIKNYFRSDEDKDDNPVATEFFKYINRDPNLWGISHVPLNLSILCGLRSQILKSSSIKNLTELYEKIVIELLRESINISNANLGAKDMLNDDIYKKCHLELQALEYLAFHSFSDATNETPTDVSSKLFQSPLFGNLNAEYKEKNNNRPLLEALNDTRLLKNIGNPDMPYIHNTHEFAHLTFQEFFAAFYIIKGLQYEHNSERYMEAKIFISEKKYIIFYKMVFLFIAGLLSSDKRLTLVQTDFWNILQTEPLDITEVHHTRLLITCFDQADASPSIPDRTAIYKHLNRWLQFIFTPRFDSKMYQEIIAEFSQCTSSTMIKIIRDRISQTARSKRYDEIFSNRSFMKYMMGNSENNLFESILKSKYKEELIKYFNENIAYLTEVEISLLENCLRSDVYATLHLSILDLLKKYGSITPSYSVNQLTEKFPQFKQSFAVLNITKIIKQSLTDDDLTLGILIEVISSYVNTKDEEVQNKLVELFFVYVSKLNKDETTKQLIEMFENPNTVISEFSLRVMQRKTNVINYNTIFIFLLSNRKKQKKHSLEYDAVIYRITRLVDSDIISYIEKLTYHEMKSDRFILAIIDNRNDFCQDERLITKLISYLEHASGSDQLIDDKIVSALSYYEGTTYSRLIIWAFLKYNKEHTTYSKSVSISRIISRTKESDWIEYLRKAVTLKDDKLIISIANISIVFFINNTTKDLINLLIQIVLNVSNTEVKMYIAAHLASMKLDHSFHMVLFNKISPFSKSSDAEIRYIYFHILHILAEHPNFSEVLSPLLIPSIDDESLDIRLNCYRALSKLPLTRLEDKSNAVTRLLAKFDEDKSDSQSQYSIINAFAKICENELNDAVILKLIKELEKPMTSDIDVRMRSAIIACKPSPTPENINFFLSRLNQNHNLDSALASLLGKCLRVDHNKGVINQITTWLSSENYSAYSLGRQALVSSLRSGDFDHIFDKLTNLLKNKITRKNTSKALLEYKKGCDPTVIIHQAMRFLSHSHADVRTVGSWLMDDIPLSGDSAKLFAPFLLKQLKTTRNLERQVCIGRAAGCGRTCHTNDFIVSLVNILKEKIPDDSIMLVRTFYSITNRIGSIAEDKITSEILKSKTTVLSHSFNDIVKYWSKSFLYKYLSELLPRYAETIIYYCTQNNVVITKFGFCDGRNFIKVDLSNTKADSLARAFIQFNKAAEWMPLYSDSSKEEKVSSHPSYCFFPLCGSTTQVNLEPSLSQGSDNENDEKIELSN